MAVQDVTTGGRYDLPQPLEIWLEPRGGGAARSELVDLSIEGASVRLAAPIAACDDGELDLVFCSHDLERAIRVAARVRHVIAFRDHWSYGLEFPQARRLRDQLPPRLYRLFQMGAAPRAVLDREPIQVRVSRPQRPDAWARLLDISTSGMAVDFPATGDPELASGELVNIAFDLGRDHLQFVERVKHGILAAHGARYGLEFEGALTPQFERQSDVIERFVEGADHVVRFPQEVKRRASLLGSWAKRVKPDPGEAVAVDVSAPKPRKASVAHQSARLRDISTSGMGLSLPADLDLGLCAGDEAVVSCAGFPDGPLQVVARVRRALLVDNEVCYGLEFDATHTRNFESKKRAIQKFVAQHKGS